MHTHTHIVCKQKQTNPKLKNLICTSKNFPRRGRLGPLPEGGLAVEHVVFGIENIRSEHQKLVKHMIKNVVVRK